MAAAVASPAIPILGVIVSIIATVWQIKGKVPKAESLLLALLLGVIAAGATYPLALRINQFTDTEGLARYQYQMDNNGVFQPVHEYDLPVIEFDNYLDYWGSFKPNTVHTFELRKGALNFYQINMRQIHTDMQAYYRNEK